MANLKPTEILLIVLVVLLLFGAKRLPDLAKSVGKSLKILKSEVKDLGDDHDTHAPSTPVAPTAATAPLQATTAEPVPVPVAPAYQVPAPRPQGANGVDRTQV